MHRSVALWLILLASLSAVPVFGALETCDTTTIDIDERVNCDIGDEGTCVSSGCLWCPLSDGSSQPWCFYPTDYSDRETCSNTPVSTDQRVNCYSSTVYDSVSCVESGCLWCPLSDGSSEPWCFFPSTYFTTTIPPTTTVPPTTATPTYETCDNTPISPSERLDCLTDYASFTDVESECESRGCLYCSDVASEYPTCFYKSGTIGVDTCQHPETCYNTPLVPGARDDCKSDATEDECLDLGCVWCPLTENSDDPWCFHPSGKVTAAPSCSTTTPYYTTSVKYVTSPENSTSNSVTTAENVNTLSTKTSGATNGDGSPTPGSGSGVTTSQPIASGGTSSGVNTSPESGSGSTTSLPRSTANDSGRSSVTSSYTRSGSDNPGVSTVNTTSPESGSGSTTSKSSNSGESSSDHATIIQNTTPGIGDITSHAVNRGSTTPSAHDSGGSSPRNSASGSNTTPGYSSGTSASGSHDSEETSARTFSRQSTTSGSGPDSSSSGSNDSAGTSAGTRSGQYTTSGSGSVTSQSPDSGETSAETSSGQHTTSSSGSVTSGSAASGETSAETSPVKYTTSGSSSFTSGSTGSGDTSAKTSSGSNNSGENSSVHTSNGVNTTPGSITSGSDNSGQSTSVNPASSSDSYDSGESSDSTTSSSDTSRETPINAPSSQYTTPRSSSGPTSAISDDSGGSSSATDSDYNTTPGSNSETSTPEHVPSTPERTTFSYTTSPEPYTCINVTERIACLGRDLNQQECDRVGCHYCPPDDPDDPDEPWCYYDTTDCTNGDRVSCTDGADDFVWNATECRERGCLWCPTENFTDTWCYYDTSDWVDEKLDVVDCYPESATPLIKECEARDCEWVGANNSAPWCTFPYYYGYQVLRIEVGPNDQDFLVVMGRIQTAAFYRDPIELLCVELRFETLQRLRIQAFPCLHKNYRVPIDISRGNITLSSTSSTYLYDFEFQTDDAFSFQILRRKTQTMILDSEIGGFTFYKQFIQMATYLPSSNFYGFGENQQSSYLHDFNYKTYAFWNRDQSPDGTANLYGTQPYYTIVEDDGNVHSVLFLNSNAQEITLTPDPALIYRTTGGVLDMYIFFGPTAEETVQQYTEVMGRFPIPPYWSLGFQISRYGYENTQAIEEVISRTANAEIPQDVQYADIDITDEFNVFTVDPVNFGDLNESVTAWKEAGVKFISVVDPGITINASNYPVFESAKGLDIWIKTPSGAEFTGIQYPDSPVYYPDFYNPTAQDWWKERIIDFHQNTLNWDGLWLVQSEISNVLDGDYFEGCDLNNTYNSPPYLPHIRDELYTNTVCPDSVHYDNTSHYDLHNMYGYLQAIPTLEGVQEATNKRGLVLSRANFAGSGKYSAHWLGNYNSTWTSLKSSIIGILQYNMFGIPMVGADICGFVGNTTYELCKRWHQVGAFYPLARNHNNNNAKDQDPAVWDTESFITSTKEALKIRYTILPYLYTLFYHHYVEGGTVVRPLWHEYPTDSNTLPIDTQFLLGRSILISPVLDEGATTVDAYFPTDTWYSYYDGVQVTETGNVTLDAPEDFIPVHIRGGNVIPTQEPALNTVASRKNPLGFIVALNSSNVAYGDLYYDDGESIDGYDNGEYFYADITVENSIFSYTVVKNTYADMSDLTIGSIIVLGVDSVSSVTVTSDSIGSITSDFSLETSPGQTLNITLSVAADEDFQVQWS